MSERQPTVQDMIATAGAGGWEWFEQFNRHMALGAKPKSAADIERDGEARRRLAEATARIFDGEDGALLLEHWLDATLRRQVFWTQLGMSTDQVVVNGAFREGMCAFVLENLKLIAEGRREVGPIARER